MILEMLTENILPRFLVGVLLFLGCITAADLLDRVAVIVGNKVITESEVLDELRLSEFMNRQPLDLGPTPRRAAAERLVDQQLIRNEMEISHYSQAPVGDADAVLRKFRQERFSTLLQYRTALAQYRITEDELKGHLLWKLTAIRYADARFRFGTPATSTEAVNHTGSDAVASPNNRVDEQMAAWLKETRSNTRIVFKQPAFQ